MRRGYCGRPAGTTAIETCRDTSPGDNERDRAAVFLLALTTNTARAEIVGIILAVRSVLRKHGRWRSPQDARH